MYHRFQEMDQQRKKQKVDLEAREAAALAGANRGGKGGGMPMGQGNAPGINTHVLDELRKLGQKQREEEAQRIEEALRVGERIHRHLSNCRDLQLVVRDVHPHRKHRRHQPCRRARRMRTMMTT